METSLEGWKAMTDVERLGEDAGWRSPHEQLPVEQEVDKTHQNFLQKNFRVRDKQESLI